MNNPIKLTEKAIQKIRELTDKSNKFALRLDLKKVDVQVWNTLWNTLIKLKQMKK